MNESLKTLIERRSCRSYKTDPIPAEILGQILEEEPHLQEYHGIFVHHDSRSLYCDVVIDFDCRDPYEVADRITGRLKKEFPDYLVYITVDNFFA